MNAICLETYIPLRSQPSESSEMVTQILFGETFSVLESSLKWVYIKNDFDDYYGWCDRKLITVISDLQLQSIKNTPCTVASEILFKVEQKGRSGAFSILAGSLLYNLKDNEFNLLNNRYRIIEPSFSNCNTLSANKITEIAQLFLNTPYLWGGRSSFGIDCSGLVQTCCRIVGIRMFRDAFQQVKQGTEVDSLRISEPGDLVFFENEENKIVHTGILLSPNEVIHASGYVRIDKIDEKGIFNEITNTYTHKLKIIRRVNVKN